MTVPKYSKNQLLALAQLPGLVLIIVALFDRRFWPMSVAGAILFLAAHVVVKKLDRRWMLDRPFSLLEPARQAIETAASGAESVHVSIVMESRGEHPVSVIRALRGIYLLGLKDAHDMLEQSEPWTIKSQVSQAEAEFVKAKLEAEGATVRIVQQ